MMSHYYTKTTLAIAGLWVDVYKTSTPDELEALPVAVLFIMHGRMGSKEDGGIMRCVDGLFTYFDAERKAGKPKRDLVIVSFDQRNHGSRMIDAERNKSWGPKGSPDGGNDSHAYDMYGIFTGTAQDVSLLIDYLPSYLYPNDERTIDQWIASGISLGGHSTWTVLANEPRVRIGIPIIGCPSLINIYTSRCAERGVPYAPPYIPHSFLALLSRTDVSTFPALSASPFNPFMGKRVLILCGAEDKAVPWACGKAFVEEFVVGEKGVKKVVVQPGVGHDVTREMVDELSRFVWEEALAPKANL